MLVLIHLELYAISEKLQGRVAFAGDLSQLEDHVFSQNFSFNLYTPSIKGLVLQAMQQFSS